MITVSEAKQQVLENCPPSKTIELPLLQAVGSILSKPVFAAIDTPPFHQSAMDGYAFNYHLWDKISSLEVIGEVQAGNVFSTQLKANQALRIFTGAAIPASADTVIMQEKVKREHSSIWIVDEQISKGSNVRPKGSQTPKGAIALESQQVLTPAGAAFLAGMGIQKVEVFAKPKVSIIVTGKELVNAGENLIEGKVFESNSVGLLAGLHQLGIHTVEVVQVADVAADIENAITQHLQSDMLLLTGGVSVGDYDLVPACLKNCGVKKVFHKVKQRPGKPLYFGTYNKTLVFALPGNPGAVMTCFYEYVALAISQLTQRNYYKSVKMTLAKPFHKTAGLTQFMKVKIENNSVEILDHQLSYLLNSFALADCLVELEENRESYQVGDLVRVTIIADPI
jgi:molybdopterin molybdotransferase